MLDPGSHTLKAGYAAYNTPADMEPSVVRPNPAHALAPCSCSVQTATELLCVLPTLELLWRSSEARG